MFPKFVSVSAAAPHELRKRGTRELLSLSGRSIGLTETLLLLAGVLLCNLSLDWLSGLTGELPQTVPQFGDPDSAGIRGLRRRRMNKIVAFCEFHASYPPPRVLAFRGGVLGH